jgi:hypothetical protein
MSAGLSRSLKRRRFRLLLSASTALPLTILGAPANGQAIVQNQVGDITVDAASAGGAPAVALTTSGGSIDASVDTVTGEGNTIVNLQASDDDISGKFGSVTSTGPASIGIYANNLHADISLDVGAIDLTLGGTTGIRAVSYGDIVIDADSIVKQSTDNIFEALGAQSISGSVTVDVGTIVSAPGAGLTVDVDAADVADVTLGSVTSASTGSPTISVVGDNGAHLHAGTIENTGSSNGNQTVYVYSSNGPASLVADTINTHDIGAQVTAGSNITAEAGSITAGRGRGITLTSNGGGDIAGDFGSITVTNTSGQLGWALGAFTINEGTIDLDVDRIVGSPGSETS